MQTIVIRINDFTLFVCGVFEEGARPQLCYGGLKKGELKLNDQLAVIAACKK